MKPDVHYFYIDKDTKGEAIEKLIADGYGVMGLGSTKAVVLVKNQEPRLASLPKR